MPTRMEGPYQDRGTGQYQGPTEPTTVDLSGDLDGPTGLVPSVTADDNHHTWTDHEGAPTGAADGRGVETSHDWPATAESAAEVEKQAVKDNATADKQRQASVKMVESVENKSVTKASKKAKKA